MTPEEWVRQLSAADFNVRARALAALVQLGGAARAALRPLLEHPVADLRALAAQALAEIGDPRDADLFAHALGDTDPRVRARGAQGLALIHDPRALDALLHTLHDLPDLLHYPATLSTYLLIDAGTAALPRLLPLLKAADLVSRQRAWLIIQTIAADLETELPWAELWHTLGSYRADSPASERNAAADLWAVWIAQHTSQAS